jgi:hypothetical protein
MHHESPRGNVNNKVIFFVKCKESRIQIENIFLKKCF